MRFNSRGAAQSKPGGGTLEGSANGAFARWQIVDDVALTPREPTVSSPCPSHVLCKDDRRVIKNGGRILSVNLIAVHRRGAKEIALVMAPVLLGRYARRWAESSLRHSEPLVIVGIQMSHM
jgi:hypothetical protein